ncbi:MAG: hypothetical protein ACLFUB_07230 [Cyclobacteriaceae bacterium]
MIPIPQEVGSKLIELDQMLQDLGRILYGRKIFGVYQPGNEFVNFHLELHPDGSFSLHFAKSILGSIEHKRFQAHPHGNKEIIEELNLLIALVRNKLKLVNA